MYASGMADIYLSFLTICNKKKYKEKYTLIACDL